MEWIEIARWLWAAVSPFVGKAAEKAAEQVGEEAGGKVWKKLEPALEKKPIAKASLEELASDPDDAAAQEALIAQLAKLLAQDAALVAGVNELLPLPLARDGNALALGEKSLAVGGQGIGFHTVHGNVSIAQAAPAAGADPKRVYLERVLRDTGDLPLDGVDPEARANPNLRLRLRAIYTGLTLAGYAAKERGRKRVDPSTGRERPCSALEALNHEDRLVLLGAPGGGKSTFVNFVAHCLAGEGLGEELANLKGLRAPLPKDDGSDGKGEQPFRHGGLLPLRIVLRDFAASGLVTGAAKDLTQFIESQLEKDSVADVAPWLRQELLQGRVLVLLDGLDEVPEPQKLRKTLVLSLSEFVKSHGRCRYVVTSRIDPYRNQGWQLPGFTAAELAPFSEGQIRSFLRRWYEHAAEMRPNRFAEAPAIRAGWLEGAIFRMPNLRELAGRPLLLTLMAAVHAWRGKLPDDRQQLYEEMVDLLLARWDDRYERDAQNQRKLAQPEIEELAGCSKAQVRQALEALAYEAHANQQELNGTADIAAEVLAARLFRLGDRPDIQGLILYLQERAGLLLERSPGLFTFPHRSFQEYLAACHLLHKEPRKLEELALADVDRWREVLLLAAAKMRGLSEYEVWCLLDRLCRESVPTAGSEPEQRLVWGARLAGQVLQENFLGKDALRELSPHDAATVERIRGWQLAILRGSSLAALERHRAGVVLGELGDPRFDADFFFLPKEENLGFVEVPAGPFLLGSDPKADRQAWESEQSQQRVDLPFFRVARYPVTVAQYRAFVVASGYELDLDWLAGRPAHSPVIMVSWFDAVAYCEWLTGRLRERGRLAGSWRASLPTEEQWEKAARGVGGAIYPWQGAFLSDLCNSYETGIHEPSVVGAFSRGASPFGVEEASGNVFEWTSSVWRESYSATPGEEQKDSNNASRVVRGGAFGDDVHYVRCAYRYCSHPQFRFAYGGFRVALAPFSVP